MRVAYWERVRLERLREFAIYSGDDEQETLCDLALNGHRGAMELCLQEARDLDDERKKVVA